jgi:uracil-DNA glycosylase family 4
VSTDQIKEHLRFAKELGVAGISRDPAWRVRETADTALSREPRAVSPDPVSQSPESRAQSQSPSPLVVVMAGETLDAIRLDIGPDCSRCKLHTLGRSQVVFGVGNPDADLMFVGRAGQLLTKIIEAIELKREDVYIANVIKCRPPQNRNPEPDEVEQCEPFLFRQIDVIKPKVIVALGKFGAQTLLRTLEPISRLRGRVFDYRGSKLIPTFHPAYLLRNPSSKREVWEDMKLVRSLLKG